MNGAPRRGPGGEERSGAGGGGVGVGTLAVSGCSHRGASFQGIIYRILVVSHCSDAERSKARL
jgi:hypothetical protein